MSKIFLIIFLTIGICCFGADLPDKGIDPPPVLGPPPDGGGDEVDPNVPIGNGISVILLLSGWYIIKKAKQQKNND